MGFMRSAIVYALSLVSACEGLTVPDVSSITAKRASSYWYENIQKQGIAPFAPSGYKVFRNVKDYGAVGDGVHDDTAAINDAISSGGRCGRLCAGTTITPATVYFPAGTYLVSASIIDQYYTNLVGDPTNLPVLKAASGLSDPILDGDKYYGDNDPGNPNWISTTVFYRQVRNFVLDTTAVPATRKISAIHWPTAQATSLQNIVFRLSAASGTQHVGLWIENGSGGFVTDLTINGGYRGLEVGNQQFTMRNLVFNNCVTAIYSGYTWEWVYQGISINNCQVGVNMDNAALGSITLIDSSISNTPVGIITSFSANQNFPTANSLILENVSLNNVPVAIQKAGGGTVLAGGTTTIAGWGQGHKYTPSGPSTFQGAITPNTRPSALLSGGKYYTRSKPQYETLPLSSFKSVRSAGAKGDATTDDTTALQNIINSATAAGQIVYFDAGIYRITKTLTIPPGAKIVGEEYPVIMSSGSFFNDMNNPKAVVQVGAAGQTGQVEWSDMIVSTQGTQAGAILIQWNLATSGTPSGMWDVHTRIGGFKGSNQQLAQCPVTASSTNVNRNCIAAYMGMHITKSATRLYMENVWHWTADHDIEDGSARQITIYTGRGLLVESTAGVIWLVGTSVEHFVLYQYQFVNTQNIYMGVVQTETPYYQPNPTAPTPFTVSATYHDPDFVTACAGKGDKCKEAWGLRILDSKNILTYAAGLYSFFINNDPKSNCAIGGGPANGGIQNCQDNILSLEGSLTNINIYNVGTVGVINMITEKGVTRATSLDNIGGYQNVIALYQLASQSGGGGGTTPPPAGGWSYKGCYTDNLGGRALTGQSVPGGADAMTVEACQNVCNGLSQTLAGLEYGGECFCGNSIAGDNTAAPDGEAQCNMKCNGNSAQTCGGPNRLSLYSFGTAKAKAAKGN